MLALLQRFGRDPTGFQLLEPGLTYWFHGDDAVIGYSDVGMAWVSAGEPVCAEARVPEVVAAFVASAARAGRRVRFFHVSETFVRVSGLDKTHVGELPIWDPADWSDVLKSSRSLREQLRRARAKGVSTRLVPAVHMADLASHERRGAERLVERWLAARSMRELKFMVLLHPFGFPEQRRFLVAERAGEVIGLAVAIPVYGRNGWFVEDVLRDPHAPNGTAELLIDGCFRAFAEEGAHYVTLGLAPLAGEVRPLLALARRYTSRLYNFPGVHSFKEKLKPRRWDPIYLAYPREELGLLAMRDVLGAFAPRGLLRFALETVVHQRTLATLLLTALLVPWTLATALVERATWFPSARVQQAWVLLDLVLIGAMLSLVRKWRVQVAEAVVLLTTLDALLTTAQVLLWNVWTARGLVAWLVLLLGCTGPLLAATFFWSTRRVAMEGRRMLT